MRTLSLRTHIRYITFCTVFLLLAVGYGAAFHSVSDTCDILRRSDNLRALASLSEYAEAKRRKKGIPLLVGNIGHETFGKDENTLILFDETGHLELPHGSKQILARQLIDQIAKRL